MCPIIQINFAVLLFNGIKKNDLQEHGKVESDL